MGNDFETSDRKFFGEVGQLVMGYHRLSLLPPVGFITESSVWVILMFLMHVLALLETSVNNSTQGF